MTRAARMLRSAVVLRIVVLAALAAGALPAAAAGSADPVTTPRTPDAGAPHPRVPYAARLASCRRSPRIAGRVATVAASMRPIPNGTRLELRVELYQRPLADGRWQLRADVPGLGTWTAPSDPTIGSRPADLFKYRQAVARLVVPFAYRFKVRFRWRDAQGAIVREAGAVTRTCREPDLRPDLAIVHVRARRLIGQPGLVRYAVRVRNGGRSSARAVVVAATLPGDAAPGTRTRVIARIAPRAVATVTFEGPGCPAGAAAPSFAVDPANAIEEVDEANNAATLPCPVP